MADPPLATNVSQNPNPLLRTFHEHFGQVVPGWMPQPSNQNQNQAQPEPSDHQDDRPQLDRPMAWALRAVVFNSRGENLADFTNLNVPIIEDEGGRNVALHGFQDNIGLLPSENQNDRDMDREDFMMHSQFMRENQNRIADPVLEFDARARLRTSARRRTSRNRGMKREHIERIGTRKFKPGKGALGEDLCSICYSEFQTGVTVRELPCGHMYHPVCIDVWLESNMRCPMCRGNVPELLKQKAKR